MSIPGAPDVETYPVSTQNSADGMIASRNPEGRPERGNELVHPKSSISALKPT